MRPFLLLTLTTTLLTRSLMAADTCKVVIQLNKCANDKIKIEVRPSISPGANAAFVFPSVIPGSYARKDFGRFISGFRAYDKKGKKLSVKKSGTNVYVIPKGDHLERIEYWADDTWDAGETQYIFQPGGTNINCGKNYVLNHHGFVGYFEGQKSHAYKITCHRPEGMFSFGSTIIKRSRLSDTLISPSYIRLVDSPVMIGNLDTTSFLSGNMNIHIGIYSENGWVKSDLIHKAIQPLAEALKGFFGVLPVTDYYFIMYFPTRGREGITRFGGYGALEHSYSSFYFLPESKDHESLTDMIQSVAGHEFLHILTPLNIHSEEIGNFDFRTPKMSQHLWMYEGVTEYFSHLIRARARLIDEKGFQEEILGKIRSAESYPPVSFTEMSKNILETPWKDMYLNVYEKGALLGFALDLKLLELSKGSLGLRELMMILAEKYGPDLPFKDTELIPTIVQLTFPEIKSFFDSHVMGKEELPLKDILNLIGWEFYRNEEVEFFTFGEFKLYGNRITGEVLVLNAPPMRNNFGLKSYDRILEVNGIKMKHDKDSLFDLLEEPADNKEIILKVQRENADIILNARPHSKKEVKSYFLRTAVHLTEEQRLFRKRYFER